jgi:hypothetical protein
MIISLSLAATSPYINVKDYGATGNGSTNDTAAIRNAITAAQLRGQTVTLPGVSVRTQAVVYFPSGCYVINDTLSASNLSFKGENGAVLKQTNSGKDIISMGVWRCNITGLSFFGGKNQIYLSNNNTDQTQLLIKECQFAAAADCAIRTGPTTISAQLIIRDCTFANCNQVLVNWCDKAKITDCWISGEPSMANQAVIENHNDLLCDSIIGVPRVTPGNNQRWIDNYVRIKCRNFRFGGEGGGYTPVVNFAKYDHEWPVIPRAVILENCDIYLLGSDPGRRAAVYCEEIPNQIVVNNCRGLCPDSDPDNSHAVLIAPSINLDTYFDLAQQRPQSLRYLIDPSTVELSNNQRDLPEQMRPYQANAIEADTCPTTGWWKAGTFVRNRNCTDQQTPFGWLCTTSGKPGTWKEISITFPPIS